MSGPSRPLFGRALTALIAAAVLAAMPAAPALAKGHTQTKTYDWGLGDVTVLCGSGRGGVCFAPASGETRVAVKAVDDLLNPVGIVLEFRDKDDVTIGNLIPACGQIASTSLPANAKTVVVAVDGPVFGPQDCLLQGLGIGTTGKITATFA